MANNEVRLIDANALIRVFEWAKTKNKPNEECATALDLCIELFKQAPTVDAVEVVHGRWLDNGMCNHKPSRFRNPDKWTVYKCSECGYSNGRRKNANYCPNCGAKMDGDGNDQ